MAITSSGGSQISRPISSSRLANAALKSLSSIAASNSWTTAGVFQPHGTKNGHGRAPVGEGRLQEVESDECGEPEPVGRQVVGQGEGQQNHCASHQAYCTFNCHSESPSSVSG